MKSRRVRRVRTAERQAEDVVATYRVSSKGLTRVFAAIVGDDDPRADVIVSRAAHHLAELEARLPQVRHAIRSCRYPGAEKGDAQALLWGLWGHLSDTALHIQGAVSTLEALGRRTRPAAAAGDAAGVKPTSRKSSRKTTKKRVVKEKGTPKKAKGAPASARKSGAKSGKRATGSKGGARKRR